MKVIERVIYSFQDKDFFVAIRSKIEYARVVALAARHLLLNDNNEEKIVVESSMKLIVDKMSRLFFYKESKYFSISFPFITLLNGKDVVQLTTYTGREVNNKIISAAVAILDNEQFRLNPSLVDLYIEPGSIDSSGIFLLEELFQSEPSYVRYDCDPGNENGKLHPLNHLDVNYSQYGTFKLGFSQAISQTYFENLQNIKTDCSFITD